MKKKAKKALTLIEIMIVMLILGLISGLFMFNMKGSLEEGKAFKTEQASQQIQEIFSMQIAMGVDPETIQKEPELVLKNAKMFKDPKSMLKDGWGVPYQIEVSEDDEVFVRSEKFLTYVQKQKNISEEALKEKYSWMFPPAKIG
ncbi:MAG: type II secretion system protein [Chlamydiae bacterium]|nr:type II secretion system protein [Chlamydiota bacterium]